MTENRRPMSQSTPEEEQNAEEPIPPQAEIPAQESVEKPEASENSAENTTENTANESAPASPAPEKPEAPAKSAPSDSSPRKKFSIFSQDSGNSPLTRLKLTLGRLAAFIREQLSVWLASPRARFLSVMWGVCFIFLGVTLLSSSNPFRLFLPDGPFPTPVRDERVLTSLYGMDAAGGDIVSVKRKMAPEKDLEIHVRKIAFMISRPMGLLENPDGAHNSLAPLPKLGLAIKSVWFQKKTARLLVDLRRSSLRDELAGFHKHRKLSRKEKKKRKKNQLISPPTRELDGFFRAFAASLFTSRTEIRSLSFRIDGEISRYPGMKFDLAREYSRAEVLAPEKSSTPRKKPSTPRKRN